MTTQSTLQYSFTFKTAQQRMFFLWQLKKFNMPQKVMVEFYTAVIESILTSSITVWFAASTAKDNPVSHSPIVTDR